uniref:Uncharacterized protein n=1 Tax=Candidatus Kentrum sp. TC TaxID=2126339 RepID=A0A450YXM1_9GAMM|nr:MAG: hypothetical protein BECKTC1821E_GA0114239_10625 [Candidatus Kentron sp. TC]VFK49249.1 MAG: hypothetical protein BECKTC1821D_GA0114238_10733 [Candidatus Kentron sp. TC]VFK61734.1 MAG: hypothetical protein BECKTC1821F_GA0114240_10625 [Candidatus Kentron sp. TC]
MEREEFQQSAPGTFDRYPDILYDLHPCFVLELSATPRTRIETFPASIVIGWWMYAARIPTGRR